MEGFPPLQRSQIEHCLDSLIEAVLGRIQESVLAAEPTERPGLLAAVSNLWELESGRKGESLCPRKPA